MIHIWLAHNNGRVRLYLQDEWHVLETWQDVSGLLKQSGIADDSVCLYIPSVNVIQSTKAMSRAQLKQLGEEGLRYLLEEDVLGNVDELLVKQQMLDDENVLLTAVNKNLIATFAQSLELVGLKLRVVLADYLLLPKPADITQICLYTDSEVQLLRESELSGTHLDDASFIINKLLAEKLHEVDTVAVVGSQASDIRRKLMTELTREDVTITASPELSAYPVEHPERHVFNLMPKQKGTGLPPYLKVVAMVAMLTLVCVLAYDAMRVFRYKKLESSYQAQIYKQYKQWFPNERAPVDIVKTIQSKSSQGSDKNNTLFSAFSTASALIKQNDLNAKSISLNEKGISIDIVAHDMQELQGLTDNMTSQGLQATLGNVTSLDNEVKGMINIAVE